jgi:membrane-associated protease RseP (regulator of RpoE activity)
MGLLGWVVFVLALAVSLMLHETGHFVAAKRFRMKATQYFIGLGPTVWSTRRGETEYGVKALPLGAFVRITGMTSLEDVDPADEPRAMRSHPRWQRAVVMLAGSATQFLLALVLLAVLAGGVGLENSDTTRLGGIGACVPASTRALDHGTCRASEPESPARLAGLRAGDQIVAFNGRPVRTWTGLASAIDRARAGQPAVIRVTRDGRTLTVRAVLAAIPGRRGAYLGISAATVFQRENPVQALGYAGTTFGQTLASSARVLGSLPQAIPELFAKDRDQTSAGQLTSLVGAGQITSAVVAAPVGWPLKVAFVLLIVATLNIVIGAFNLLPLLPLDGGHLAVIVYEQARAGLARLRGRADPGLASMTVLGPVSVAVFAVLIAFSLVLVAADIVNPVTRGL